MKQLLLAVALVAAACSGGQKTGSGGGGGGGGSGTDDGSDGGHAAGSGSGGAASGPITRVECEDMVGHILDVGVAESKKKDPPEQWPTDEQVQAIRNKMINDPEGMKRCLAFDRSVLTCVMAAADTAAMQGCLGAEE